jgi:3-hydroxyacyl-CoA dehydrogenase
MNSSLPVHTIGIMGSGQMGAGIAQVAAQTGYSVLL